MTSVQTVDEAELVSGPVVVIDPGVLRVLLSTFVLALMNAEVDARCGAGHGQHSKQRVNSRRGYRRRDLRTAVGRVELSIPRLRSGVYRPDWLMSKPEQAERALTDAITVGYRHGLSVDRLRKLVDELGATGVPEAQLPKLAQQLEARLDAVRAEPAASVPAQHTAPGAAELADEPRHLATADFLGMLKSTVPEVGSEPKRKAEDQTEPTRAAESDIPSAPGTATKNPVSTRCPRRRPPAVAATLILALLSGVALCSLLAPQGGSAPSDFQAMMPALVNVIAMPQQVTKAELLAATCGALHDDFHRTSDTEIIDLVKRMDTAFGARTIDRVERLRRDGDHTAHAVVTATAERLPAPGHPGGPVDVEFDTSTTPWKICAVTPAAVAPGQANPAGR